MKYLLLALCGILSFKSLRAQEQVQRHSIRTNLLTPIVKTVSLQYEYSLTAKKSLLFQVGYTFPERLLEKYNDRYKAFGTRKLIFKDLTFTGGFQITPEFRYYFKEKESSGLFVAGYLRYSRYALTSHVNYESDQFNVLFTFKGAYTSVYAGFLTGYKWNAGKHFVIETWLLGLHGGYNQVNLSAADEFEFVDKPTFIADIEETFKDFPFIKKRVARIVDRDVKVGFGYAFAGARAGICLGYRF
jgi:hypothetical protein